VLVSFKNDKGLAVLLTSTIRRISVDTGSQKPSCAVCCSGLSCNRRESVPGWIVAVSVVVEVWEHDSQL
jgi:hypothetical protein